MSFIVKYERHKGLLLDGLGLQNMCSPSRKIFSRALSCFQTR